MHIIYFCVHTCGPFLRPGEGIRCPDATVAGTCESPNVDAGNKTAVLCTFNLWAIFSIPYSPILWNITNKFFRIQVCWLEFWLAVLVEVRSIIWVWQGGLIVGFHSKATVKEEPIGRGRWGGYRSSTILIPFSGFTEVASRCPLTWWKMVMVY